VPLHLVPLRKAAVLPPQRRHARLRQVAVLRSAAPKHKQKNIFSTSWGQQRIAAPGFFRLTMSPKQAAQSLVEATIAMHQSGTPLMRRVLSFETEPMLWEHYPESDAVSPHNGSRYFYHCHPVEERGAGEHGHFHLFLPKRAIAQPNEAKCVPIDPKADRADIVHLVALSVSPDGLPITMFTVNRWVCDEWLFLRGDIMAVIDGFDLSDAEGDPLVNSWLTAMVHLAKPMISTLLAERDERLAAANWDGEDRTLEVISSASIDLQSLVDPHLD
jgi:hypothetical protein